MTPLSRLTPATLDVLQCLLSTDATWGLQIIKLTNRPAGSIYPILERLERSGWVSSDWEDNPERPGPRRRLYSLTGDGAVAARSAVAARVARPTLRPNPAGASA